MTFFGAIDFILKNNSLSRLFHIEICDMGLMWHFMRGSRGRTNPFLHKQNKKTKATL